MSHSPQDHSTQALRARYGERYRWLLLLSGFGASATVRVYLPQPDRPAQPWAVLGRSRAFPDRPTVRDD